jgi:hypothetical protein
MLHKQFADYIDNMGKALWSELNSTIPSGYYHYNIVVLPHVQQVSQFRPRGIFSIVVIVVLTDFSPIGRYF